MKIASPSQQFPFGRRFKVNKFLGGVLKPMKAYSLSNLALQHIPEEVICPNVEVGSTLRINKSKQIYLFEGSSLRMFSSWNAFTTHGGDVSTIVDCPLHPWILKLINMGANV